MSRYLMGDELSCLFNRELIQTFTPSLTAVGSQKMPHLQASHTRTVGSLQKTDLFKYEPNSTLGYEHSHPPRQYHLLQEETSTIQTCIQMFCHWLSNSFQCYLKPPQAVHFLQGTNVHKIFSLFCQQVRTCFHSCNKPARLAFLKKCTYFASNPAY